MKQCQPKTYTILTISILGIGLLLIGLGTFLLDPLFQYHNTWFGLQPTVINERYQNAGIAKTWEFDNAIIGNSMSENFQASWFNAGWGGKTVKLTAAGSHPLDWTYILNILESKKIAPKKVIFNFDYGILNSSVEVTAHDMPTYLYNERFLDDVNYLFNFSIIHDFSYPLIKNKLAGTVPDIDQAFVWDHGAQCGKKILLDNLRTSGNESITEWSSDEKQENLKTAASNIHLLTSYIQNMSDTDFVFFVSPWNTLYWQSKVQNNSVETIQEMFEIALSELLSHDNVTVFFWVDDEMLSMEDNPDNYKDGMHFSKKVSQQIAQRIFNNCGKVTKDTYIESVDLYFTHIKQFDYHQYDLE